MHSPGYPPASLGIFGLSHEELLQSEWAQEDTLTVKVEQEVRPMRRFQQCHWSAGVEIPEPTILEDTKALLQEGKCSDVRFMVKDEGDPGSLSDSLCAIRGLQQAAHGRDAGEHLQSHRDRGL